ncbi:uncharacterized protein LOC119745009 [Patiria miniata]|uniref:Uncharacterized protein n=1 Tax=Patiria miniata TaxID=46514 RepID=A0A914BN87_PATMI|nr:uncharacterized protein LOC119745009 [Patiria miniata]
MTDMSECNEDVASTQLGPHEVPNPEGSPNAQDVYGNVPKRQRMDGNESNSSEQNSQFVSSSNAQLSTDAEQTSSQASSQWQQWRSLFKDIFIETQKPTQTQCLACGDGEGDLVRCLDCGPGVTRCIDCTLSYHKESHLLHKPELVLETGVSPFPLRSRFERKNHQCFTTHTKSIQIFDEKGRLHNCWFTSCACEAPSATLLRWNLWPATPEKPRLAFHEELLRWFESLLAEGLSLRAASEAVRRRNSLKTQEADILYRNLKSGCFEEYKFFRRHCANLGSEPSTVKNGSMYVASPKSSVSELRRESHVPSSESMNEDRMTRSDSHTTLQGPISTVTGIEPQFRVGSPGSSDPSSIEEAVRSGVSVDQNCQEWKVEPLDGDDDSEAEYILVPVNEASAPNQNGLDVKPILFPAYGNGSNQAGQIIPFPGMPPRADQDLNHFDNLGSSDVAVMPTANIGKTRVWDKRQYCLYCRESFAKLPRHLRHAHRDEPDVIFLSRTQCPITQRRLLSKLRNLGNHLQNSDVLRQGTGKLIVVKRPSPGETVARTAADYQPCPYCFGYYVLRDQTKHNCHLKNFRAESALWLNLTLQH